MEQIDYLYRAYHNYVKELANNRENNTFRKAVTSKKNPNDYLIMTRKSCDIELDWVEEIEKGIVYIEKAIHEDRQFIRNEGEVLPIEKIRRVSKDSISDLAKHSDYITKIPEEPEENIVPEKLLMIQRENDYAIYENRVLFATLSYLKDFITVRLEKIKEATNKYKGKAFIKKKVDLGNRVIDFSLTLDEEKKNDNLSIGDDSYVNVVQRIENALNSVMILLRTPLMTTVSKAPMVKRPITKTNVLKMNTNFRESLALFDYVCEYPKNGFETKEKETKIAPLTPEMEDAFSEVILMSSFLTYEYTNSIDAALHKRFLAEEKRRKEESEKAIIARIHELKEKAKKDGKEIDEYILLLEDSFTILENKIEELKASIETIKSEYETKIEAINIEHENAINELREQFELEKNELVQSFEDEKSNLNSEISSLKDEINKLNEEIKRKDEEHKKEIKEMEKKIKLAQSEVFVAKLVNEKGSINPNDFESKERFDELQREKEILDEFFDRAWKNTKKSIRKKYLAKNGGGDNEN